MADIFKSPILEATLQRAIFVQQDITIYPDRESKEPPNLVDVVKFLLGEASRVVFDMSANMQPEIVIKDATFILRDAKTVGCDWTIKEVQNNV